jgi:hypothetical protein
VNYVIFEKKLPKVKKQPKGGLGELGEFSPNG